MLQARAPSRRIAAFCVVAALLLLSLSAAPLAARKPDAASVSNDEYTLKSAFLYNFARYVKWPGKPQSSEQTLVVAVFGKNPFGKQLEQALEGKRVGAQRLNVKYFQDLKALAACHMLFVPADEEGALEAIRDGLKGHTVLIVAESIEAARHGAHIGFYLEKSRVRFAINETELRKDKLEVSSELLKLAKIVKPARELSE
jgi:hypothetical protein